jgi:drug/metabolite transporter (DMT)-like permease
MLFPFAVATLPESLPSIPAALAVLALALFSTAAGYLIFYRLIEQIGATKTLSVTLLVPVFGMIWGALILKEPITSIQIIGLLIILVSLFLITGISFRQSNADSLKAK